MWGDGDAVGSGRTGDPEHRPAGKKVVVVLVAVAVMLATLVLCCAAVGQAASLVEIDPAGLW